ncbi:MAG: hypothetical protein WCJ02_01465 [bacterium]
MNEYDAIDAVYPPYTVTDKEPRLLSCKAPLPGNDSLDDTDPATEKVDSSIQRYWNTINDAYDGV